MNSGLFQYPKQAEFGRSVPKSKIYEHGRVSASLKKKFVAQVDKIVWQYKLSPETIKLPAKKCVPEIEIFSITLREPEIREDVLRCIDNSIPFPIIYELVFNDRIKTKAAYKRPSDADSAKWVTDIYFESKWTKTNATREALPVALDLGLMYEQLIRSLMPTANRSDEDIRDQVLRLAAVRQKESEASKIESQIRREKQFNRKVELNRTLRDLRMEINGLLEHAD